MKLNKTEIDKAFEEEDHQAKVFLRLYKMVYPDWDDIKQIIGYPKVSKEVTTYLFDKWIVFDQEHHPDVLNGGLWMNTGFSTDEKLTGWEVVPAEVIRRD